MSFLTDLTQRVLRGGTLTKEDALRLYQEEPLEPLSQAADEIRRHFCGSAFDLCTIINAKSGRCSENCAFCAQSAHHPTCVTSYPLLSPNALIQDAKKRKDQGILRYSLVTSGKRLSQEEVDRLCPVIETICREVGISVCVSFGLLEEDQYRQLKEAGVTRVHNNLETSQRYFPALCTTHTFQDKCRAIRAAQAAGLEVCSGGIMGMGETVEDRIDLALSLRDLSIRSVPVNLLNPIPGTPLAQCATLSPDAFRRILAVYRFLLPQAAIRLAGGRGLLPDGGAACFRSGANAAITGDMLTTAGITPETDQDLLKKLGYERRCQHG
ncbi:MAG: biotin synthase BioB [Evtepia sp.]|uniref:biotin synthase BioB n=1 Tax=Evtepia sp. TaxID=2773933 RepID=UPI002A765E7E|nr:biotin synthase BioB [Evtepia sp.]MDY3015498.1 biotin synthase BioB [Evtepia sp.]